jgi:hypothetical protein
MKNSLYWGGFLLVMSVFAPAGAQAGRATSSIAFDSRTLVTTLWYPDNVALIRGVVVFTGGAGGGMSADTRGLVNHPFWQRFAESLGFGIVGNQFTGSYANAGDGSGQALLDSLASLATSSAHPELAHAPLLVEGFSNGGYFSFTFAQFVPSRVIAFCLNKSGFARAPLDVAFLAVPGLLIWGSEESSAGIPTVIHELVQQGRIQHALWAELKEWGVTHEEGGAERIFAPFFAEMIAARYPAGATPLKADVPLRALSEASGWLGDSSDASVNSNLPLISAFGSYAGDKPAASWLPSEGLANLWRGFVTKTPLHFAAPRPGARLDANKQLQLRASGFASGETASFFDGSQLVASAKVTAGAAKTAWNPRGGGPRGLLALAVDPSGKATRTSRPVHVVLYGKHANGEPMARGHGRAVPPVMRWTLALVGISLLGFFGFRRMRRADSRTSRESA